MRTCQVLVVCLLSTICTADEQLVYENSENHFSFVVPEGWECVETKDLPEEAKDAIRAAFPKGGAIATCRILGNEYFEPPFAIIQGYSTGEVSETIWHKLWRSPKGRRTFLEKSDKRIQRVINAEAFIPKSWKGAELVSDELEYDEREHVAIETMEFTHREVGEIVVVKAMFLGNHLFVVFRFYFDGDDTYEAMDIAQQFTDSFQYEEGYGFGEGSSSERGTRPFLL